MNYYEIANQIIPGFNLLSDEQISAFVASEAGNKFSQFIQETVTAFQQYQATHGWWSYIFGQGEEKKKDLILKFEKEKQDLIENIFQNEEYKTLLQQITFNLLEKEFPDFKLLDNVQQLALSEDIITQQSFSKVYIISNEENTILSNISDFSITNVTTNLQRDKLDELKTQKDTPVSAWIDYLRNDLSMRPFQLMIEGQLLSQAQDHATRLAAFFPLFHYRKDLNEESSLAKILHKLTGVRNNFSSAAQELEEEHLTDILFHCMQQLNQQDVGYINLDPFNLKQANHMAKAILIAFNKQTVFDKARYLKNYEEELDKYLVENLPLINNKKWTPTPLGRATSLWNSLSYHLVNSKAFKEANQFVERLSTAHAFIQATSFSTQNESSYLAILDLYNYARYNRQITETKNIIVSLLSPLLPLYREYKEIAEIEKNFYWKVFRSLMPILITVTVIVLAAAALVPLGLPELAFTAAFIPALIIGLVLATQYVSIKSRIYKTLREKWYGGPYEIPEFQVSPRMIGDRRLNTHGAFADPRVAEMVRDFYVAEFKTCDQIESQYLTKYKRGLLTEKEIKHRKTNLDKRYHLSLEWFDIHSNQDLGYLAVPQIVLTRLQSNGDFQYHKLGKLLQKELNIVHETSSKLANELSVVLDEHTPLPTLNAGPEAETIKINYRPGLFKIPRCIPFRESLEEIENLDNEIRSALLA